MGDVQTGCREVLGDTSCHRTDSGLSEISWLYTSKREPKFRIPMPITVKLPEFPQSDEKVTLDTWMKEVGDKVEAGDAMVVLKINGSTQYLEAFHYGTSAERIMGLDP
jgi:hypothetical protein